MPRHTAELLTQLQHADGVLVTVHSVEGSGPRDVGAWMAVFPHTLVNTIGGGHLEFQAIDEARALLSQRTGAACAPSSSAASANSAPAPATHEDQALTLRYALGPALGNLPCAVRWIDSRDEIFPAQVPLNVVTEHSDPVHAAVADLAPNSAVLIMSFSHAEDLDVVAACLKRQRVLGDIGFIGLIGSKTKWATFRHRLEARGFSADELARVTCPIGVEGITGKEPEVIAVAVVAQLLQQS